jgi:hypothetical protein
LKWNDDVIIFIQSSMDPSFHHYLKDALCTQNM